MKSQRLATLVFAIGSIASFAGAKPLGVGDAPPAIQGEWVKGDSVGHFDSSTIYVVEFWATICPPCKVTIPKLTALAKAHPDVVIIGASVWEEDQNAVRPFVAKMGSRMNYRVVMDDTSNVAAGTNARNWLDAAEQKLIPTTFIIHGGKIAWIGDSAETEVQLSKVMDGELNADESPPKQRELTAEEIAEAHEAKNQEVVAALDEMEKKVLPLIQIGDNLAAISAIDGIIKRYPLAEANLLGQKFDLMMASDKFDEAYIVADRFEQLNNDNADGLNALAWYIVDREGIKQRDIGRAMRYAKRAVELTKGENGAILDTLARAYFEQGDVEKAIELQEKAIKLSPPDIYNELQAAMARYKAALPK